MLLPTLAAATSWPPRFTVAASIVLGVLLLAVIIVFFRAYRRLSAEIIQRRRTEQAQRDAEQQSRGILACVDEGIFGLDSDGRTRFVNEAALTLLGYREEDLLGASMHETLHYAHPDGSPYPISDCPMLATGRDGRDRHIDNEVLWSSNGKPIPVAYSSRALVCDGQLVGSVIAVRDKRPSLAVENRLRARERQFRVLIESAPDAMVVCDSRGRILMINRQTQTVLGWHPDELIGAPIEQMIPKHLRATHPALRHQFMAEPEVRSMGNGHELVALARDGREVSVEISLSPIELDGEVQIVAAMRDVSERRRAEQAIRESDELRARIHEAERLNRLAVDRERRVVELKQEVNALAMRNGDSLRYPSAADRSLGVEPSPNDPLEPLAEDQTSTASGGLAALLDVAQLQSLLDDFCESLGISAAIVDLNGVSLAAARWMELCANPPTRAETDHEHCLAQGLALAERGPATGDLAYALIDCGSGTSGAVTPLWLDREHVANICIGRFLTEPPHDELLRQQAAKLGIAVSELATRAAEMPVIPTHRLPAVLGFLAGFAETLAALALARRRAAETRLVMERRADELRLGREAALSLAEDAEQARAEKDRYFERLEDQVQERTEELRRNREELQAILDNSPALIHVKDYSGRYTLVNRRWAQLAGIAEDHVLGHTDAEVFPPDVAAEFSRGDRQVLTDNEPQQVEDIRRSGDDELVFYTYKFPLLDDLGQPYGICGISHEVTELKRAEQEFRRARDLAEEANRAKSDFLANMSHEIRTPLNAIIGMTHLALGSELNPRQRGYIDKANRSAESLLGIINDILDFSKIEAGKLSMEATEFQLETVLEGLANAIGLKAEDKQLELLFDNDPAIPKVLVGDPLRLGQVLINLGNNAVKFTDRGEIMVKTRLVERDPEQVKLHFAISDSGIGLSPAQCVKLFRSFSQADSSTTRRFGGTGLGLAICKRLTAMMDGEIWVDSELGVGSVFHVTARFGYRGALEANEPPPPKTDDLHVLVVDDNANARGILAMLVESVGLRAGTAADGAEAIESLIAAQRAADPYQLVFMDWRMPGMDGITAARLIADTAELSPKPEVMIVTAYGQAEVVDAASDTSIAGYLAKPVSASTILDAAMRDPPLNALPRASREPSQTRDPHDLATIHNARVLLVEDHEINQELALELLRSADIEVDLACNGAEAVAKVKGGSYDAVLMDIQMPEMDGYEATRRIRAEPSNANLPIIAMTANALPTDREKSLAAGMNGHIAKPINVDELFATLARWIGGFEEPPSPPAGAAPEVGLPQLSGLDTAAGLTRCGNDVALYRSLLLRLRDDYRDFVDAFTAARRSGGKEAALRYVHGLKGNAANLGADHVAATAKALESACREDVEDASIEPLADDLGAALAALVGALEKIEPAAAVATPAPESRLSAQVQEQCLALGAEARQLLTQSDAAALDPISALSGLLDGVDQLGKTAARLAEQAQGFDFGSAAATLTTLMEGLRNTRVVKDRHPGGADEAAALLDHLAELLADDDAAAADLLPRLRNGEGIDSELLAELSRHLEDFDFSAAQQTLDLLRGPLQQQPATIPAENTP